MVRIILAILFLLPLNAHAFGVMMGSSAGGGAATEETYIYSGDMTEAGGWETTQSQEDGYRRCGNSLSPGITGTITELGVHLAAVGTATSIKLALYYGASGGPPTDRAVTECSVSSLAAGWVSCPISFSSSATYTYSVWYIPNGTITVDQDTSGGDGGFQTGSYDVAFPASLSPQIHGGVINAVRFKYE